MPCTPQYKEEDGDFLRDPACAEAHALIVRQAGQDLAEAATALRQKMDYEGQEDRLLVVVAGEKHSRPAHIVRHMAAIDRLKDRHALAVALEIPHNYLSCVFSSFALRAPSSAESGELAARDRDGKLSLTAYLGEKNSQYADHTNTVLADYLVTRHVPTRFIDAAIRFNKPQEMLDASDRRTAETVRHLGFDPANDIVAVAPCGLRARNHVMAGLGVEFARAAGARVLYVATGNAHVLGNSRNLDTTADSLSASVRALDARVLISPIMPEGVYGGHMLDRWSFRPEEQLIARGLPETTASYDAKTDRPINGGEGADLTCRLEENNYTSCLVQPCIKGGYLVGRTVTRARENYKRQAEGTFRAVMRMGR